MIANGTPTFDIVVVGAGPAGAMAAREAARLDASVLLIDSATFPRRKVCGACLNARALAVLEDTGLTDVIRRAGAVPLSHLDLWAARRRTRLPLPTGAVLSRERLDQILVDAAVDAGAVFIDGAPGVIASPEEAGRPVTLLSPADLRTVYGRVIIDATGLHRSRVRAAERIGANSIISGPDTYAAGTVSMACGAWGYVGATVREDGRLDVAAAMTPAFIRGAGGAGAAANRILVEAGAAALPALADKRRARWRGTPPLTYRPSSIAEDRLCRVGDAAGYVEPFTGEGIGWALAGGRAVAPLAVAAARDDEARRRLPATWRRTHAKLVKRRHRMCRGTAKFLRVPLLTALSARTLAAVPALGRPAIRWVGGTNPQ